LESALSDMVFNFVADSAGMIPVVGSFVTLGMTTAKGAYDIYQNDEYDMLNGVMLSFTYTTVRGFLYINIKSLTI